MLGFVFIVKVNQGSIDPAPRRLAPRALILPSTRTKTQKIFCGARRVLRQALAFRWLLAGGSCLARRNSPFAWRLVRRLATGRRSACRGCVDPADWPSVFVRVRRHGLAQALVPSKNLWIAPRQRPSRASKQSLGHALCGATKTHPRPHPRRNQGAGACAWHAFFCLGPCTADPKAQDEAN